MTEKTPAEVVAGVEEEGGGEEEGGVKKKKKNLYNSTCAH